MVDVTPERFEELVGDALDRIPDGLGGCMDNVAVFVEDAARPATCSACTKGCR